MKTLALLATVLFATVTLGPLGTAAADPKPAANRTAPKPRTANGETKPAKNFDFTPDSIDGRRQLPDGTTLFGLKAAAHSSLIKLRGDFLPEITRAAEQL